MIVSLERLTYAVHLKEGKFYAKLEYGGRRVWAAALVDGGIFQA